MSFLRRRIGAPAALLPFALLVPSYMAALIISGCASSKSPPLLASCWHAVVICLQAGA